MARTRLQFTGFNRLRDALNPRRFEQRLKREVKKATRKNGLLAVARIKTDISRQKFPNAKLSLLTRKMKGSTKALVDTGELRKSITSDVMRWDLVVIGVLRNRPTSNGRPMMKVAEALHNGATIRVTEAMRRYFFWLANSPESPVRGIVSPLSPDTKLIRIPPRPFMRGALARSMINKYKANWEAAVSRALNNKR